MSSKISALTTLTEALATGDLFPVVNVSDTTTPPAGAGGSDQKATAAVIAAALAAMSGSLVQLVPSGVTSGVTDAAAINAAITAGAKYIKLSPTAPWYIECGQVKPTTASGLTIDITGCFVNAVGAGAVFDFTDTTVPDTRAQHGGGITGYGIIDGTLTTTNSYAFHGGDIFQLKLEFQAQNFTAGTTSKGAWIDNRNYWTEQLRGRILANNCTAGIVFDVSAGNTTNTGSMERCNIDLCVDQGGPAFDGVVLQNGAFIQDGVVNFFGNFGSSASALTSAALRINGTTPGGVAQATDSNITNSVLNIGCECDIVTGTNTPYTVYFGTGSNFIGSCSGNIDFGAADAFQSSNNGGQFAGYVGVVAGDANLPSSLPGGSTNLADSNQVISSGTPTAITNVSAQAAAFTAYKIDVYVPHLGAATPSGTFTLALGGPSIALASLDIQLWTGTTLTAHTLNSSSATLSAATPVASQRSLLATGTIAFSSAGTVTVTGTRTGSNVTVDIGAYILLTPMAAP